MVSTNLGAVTLTQLLGDRILDPWVAAWMMNGRKEGGTRNRKSHGGRAMASVRICPGRRDREREEF